MDMRVETYRIQARHHIAMSDPFDNLWSSTVYGVLLDAEDKPKTTSETSDTGVALVPLVHALLCFLVRMPACSQPLGRGSRHLLARVTPVGSSKENSGQSTATAVAEEIARNS